MDSPQNEARNSGAQDDPYKRPDALHADPLAGQPDSFSSLDEESLDDDGPHEGDAEEARQVGMSSARPTEGPPLDYTNLAGRQIGRYRIEQQIGSGGVAVVYQAYDQVQGIPVALKVLMPHADASTYNRFRREALTAGGLHFEHIVRIRQVGTLGPGGLAYMAMELVDGESLSDLLSTHGKLHPQESCNLLEPIARALGHAHQAGIVHRDVKPSNILLRTASPGAAHSVQLQTLEYPVVPLLSDFGVARYLDAPELTNTGRTVGTPAYMAPEQCAGNRDVDGRADIYALGCVLYRCVAGHPPFAGSVTQILHAHVYEPLGIDNETLQLLPPVLVEILRRSLAKKPEERYASADEMALALAFAAGRTVTPRTPNQPDATSTLTLEAAPPVAAAGPTTATTVLVPGVQTGASAPAQSTRPRAAANPLTARSLASVKAVPAANVGAPPPPREERFYRFTWVLLPIALAVLVLAFVIAIIGSPFGLGRGDEAGANGASSPTVGLVGGVPTFTPTAGSEQAPSEQNGQPSASPVATLPLNTDPAGQAGGPLATATTQAAFTPIPTWTPTVLLTSLPTLTPSDTWTPTMTPTPTLTATLTPLPSFTWTPEPTATPSPEVVDTATPSATSCSAVPDPIWTSFITGLNATMQQGFLCAYGAAEPVNAERLDFEQGFMLRLDNHPDEVYIYYNGENRWQVVRGDWSQDDSTIVPDIVPGPDFYLPSGAFARVWSDEQIRDNLGFALAPEPLNFPGKIQAFPGGTLIYNFVDGQVRAFFTER